MPRDVSTRWNSTYDMLDFAVNYQSAIDDMTGDKTTNLRRYELDDGEWKIAEQLRNTLKVRVWPHLENKFPIRIFSVSITDFQRRHSILLPFNALPRDGHSGYGPHRRDSHNQLSRSQVRTIHSRCPRNCQENPQQILQRNRSIGSVSHRNGYVAEHLQLFL
jgi:hypothetical protein